MIDVLQVDFKFKNKVASIKLYSKFTVIHGDSGNGKSEFVEKYEDGRAAGTCTYWNSEGLEVFVISTKSTDISLKEFTRCIYLVDEIAMRTSNILAQMKESPHLFIIVCHGNSIAGGNPLYGSYTLQRYDEDWFKFTQDTLPLYDGTTPVDVIVTESDENRSEHEFLSAHCSLPLKFSKGRDNVNKVVRTMTGNVLVLMDLGNVSNALHLLQKRSKDNPNMRFYDYNAFEELLYESPVTPKSNDVSSNLSSFDVYSIEQYYETLLSSCTQGTEYEYVHGAPLSQHYLDSTKTDVILNSAVGELLYNLIAKFPKEGFCVEEYFQSVLGNKAEFLPKAAVSECKTKEDCDALIDSLKNVL